MLVDWEIVLFAIEMTETCVVVDRHSLAGR